MNTREERLELDKATIYYQTRGRGDPLVLVHGLSGSSRWWARNVDYLARHFQVYMVDLIGFGQSRGRFILGESSRLLAEWMDNLQLERVRLIGHSMGGYIAADLAANYGERLERLVLVDAAAVPLRRSYFQTAMGLMLAFQYMPLGFLPVLANDALRAGVPTILQATREIFLADMRASLSKITVPTLILWGEHDTILPPEIGRRLHLSIPEAKFVMIEGAGHNPMWDRPALFNRTLLKFL